MVGYDRERLIQMGRESDKTPLELKDRFLSFITFLESKGGRYQRTLEDLGEDVGISRTPLRRILNRAQELGVLDVTVGAHPILTEGRFPNQYRLMMSVAEFEERKLELCALRLEGQRRRRVAKPKVRKVKPARSISEVIANLTPGKVPFGSPAALGLVPEYEGVDFDVDAWAGGVDFDDL